MRDASYDWSTSSSISRNLKRGRVVLFLLHSISIASLILADYFSSACSSKEVAFSVTRDGRELIPEEVVAIQSEPDALEKVTFNFFSNALKYTPRGNTIELGLQSQPKNWTRLFVKDSGPGISEEGQTKLFQVFSQVEGSTTREYEGTGLGLDWIFG